jgi:PatG C-terminal
MNSVVGSLVPSGDVTCADLSRSASLRGFQRNGSMGRIYASPLSGTRKVVEVVFSFTNRNTDVVAKQFVRVDVTEEFPFLLTKLSPYYDR